MVITNNHAKKSQIEVRRSTSRNDVHYLADSALWNYVEPGAHGTSVQAVQAYHGDFPIYLAWSMTKKNVSKIAQKIRYPAENKRVIDIREKLVLVYGLNWFTLAWSAWTPTNVENSMVDFKTPAPPSSLGQSIFWYPTWIIYSPKFL